MAIRAAPMRSANSASAANRNDPLQRMHGLGVRPARKPATNSSTTSWWNSSRRSRPTCGTPSAWQAARAARTDCGEQQARSPSGAPGSIHSRRVTPTGSRPASTAFSSATAESTPPDIATATRPAATGIRAESRAVASARCRASAARATQPRLDAAGASTASSSAAPMRAASSRSRPCASAQASSAAAVACGQAKVRCRAAAMRPPATASSIRIASPHAVSPASPATAPGPADPA